jgi:hypothetical protein
MRQLTSKLLIAIFLVCLFDEASHAKEWRGIAPLRSKREDVVRLLERCADPALDCAFDLENEHIRIVFSGDAPGDFSECSTSVPADTVLLIEVTHKASLQFRKLPINKKGLRSFDPSSPPNMGYKGYIDEKEGVLLNTYRGRVLQTYYIASAGDIDRCPRYYENPEALIQVRLSDSLPSLAVICPSKETRAGERITISAEAGIDRKTRFVWTLSSGKIMKGQGTPIITVDTTGLEGQTITATVEAGATAASCVIRLCPR